MTENEIGKIVVDESIQLHRGLGPGLLEIVYDVTLARRLEKKGLKVVRQVSVPIEFDGEKFDKWFRADLIVEDEVILEQSMDSSMNSFVPSCLCEKESESGSRCWTIPLSGTPQQTSALSRLTSLAATTTENQGNLPRNSLIQAFRQAKW